MESEKKREYSPDDYVLCLPDGEKYILVNDSYSRLYPGTGEYSFKSTDGVKITIPYDEFHNWKYVKAQEYEKEILEKESVSLSEKYFLLRMANNVNYIVKGSTVQFDDKEKTTTFEDAAGSKIIAKREAIFNTCVPILKTQPEYGEDKINPVDSVSILGTPYKIIREKFGNEDIDGETDYTSHQIRIRTDNINKLVDFDVLMKKQLRHEIIHAFMAESGLQANFEHYRQFGHDETTVDWFAIQFPKILEAFKQVGAL